EAERGLPHVGGRGPGTARRPSRRSAGGAPEHTRPGSRQEVRPHAPGDPTAPTDRDHACCIDQTGSRRKRPSPLWAFEATGPTLAPPVKRMEAMASLTKRIMKFVQSPQGQQLMERAKVEASKPENRRKLDQLR